MPKIDKMLQMIHERGVERALLQGDRAFQIHAGGKIVEGSVTPAAQLLELLEEIAPPAFLPLLRGGGSFRFSYASPFGGFEIGVDNYANDLQVSISPAKAQPPLVTSSLMSSSKTSPPPNLKRELYIHKAGSNVGPMSPEEARSGVENGKFALHDMAIAPHLQSWDSLQNLLDTFDAAPRATVDTISVLAAPALPSTLLRSFLNEEQDPSAVSRVIERLQSLCTPEETILYIAVQKKPVVTVAPISIALTSKRVIIFRPKALGLGLTFEDFLWRTVVDIHISEAILGATFTIRLTDRAPALVDSLPKAQARKLYQFGQQMEEHMHSHRRELMLEEKRSAAGGVNVSVNAHIPATRPLPSASLSTAAQTPADDPIEKLQKLKTMFEMSLISQAEYDAKKAEIMARF